MVLEYVGELTPSMSQKNSEDFSQPAWLTVSGACRYSGLSRSLLYRHLDEQNLISSTIRLKGRSRGRRLIQRASLDALIEQGIGQKSEDNTARNKRVNPEN